MASCLSAALVETAVGLVDGPSSGALHEAAAALEAAALAVRARAAAAVENEANAAKVARVDDTGKFYL